MALGLPDTAEYIRHRAKRWVIRQWVDREHEAKVVKVCRVTERLLNPPKEPTKSDTQIGELTPVRTHIYINGNKLCDLEEIEFDLSDFLSNRRRKPWTVLGESVPFPMKEESRGSVSREEEGRGDSGPGR